MSINVPPPEFQFTGLFYNPNWWITSNTSLSQAVANTLYLRKTTTDSASALETFNGGIKSTGYDVVTAGTTQNMFSTQTANTNLFGSMGSGQTLKLGNQTTTQSVHCSYIDCNGNTINNANAPLAGNLIIGNSQTTGQITLGGVSRTTGAINIYKPLTPLYTAIPLSTEIGYNQFKFSTVATFTSSTTAGTPQNITSFTNCPVGTWLYETLFFITTLAVGRTEMCYNTVTTTMNADYSITGITTNAGVYVKLTAILQFTNATTTIFLNTFSSLSSVNITGINTSRTRIA